jgi:hypothetical protein
LKKIPSLTALFWLLLILSYKFFPRIILDQYLQYPLIILLSILLPVSFWLKIQDGKRYQSLIFIGIFLINSTLLVFALERNYTTQKMLERNSGKGIYPELAEMLTNAESLEKRQLAARFIYQRHAVAMPYKSTGTSYVLYTPSQSDQNRYRTNFARNMHTDTIRMNATQQMMMAFFYLILHAGIFLALIVFLIVYEQEKPSPEWVQGNG